MEGKRLAPTLKPSDLLHKIREITASILVDLCNGRSPVILINKFRTYCKFSADNCLCSSNLPVGNEELTLRRQSHIHRMDVMLRVLLIVQQLLQENKHASKRDIYYTYPSLFSDQSVVDRALNDICILLECSRHNLNVVSVTKGLVMGWIRFSEDGQKFDCIASPNNAQPVPVQVEEVQDILAFAEYILVVEKESVFQRLANDQYCSFNRCIVITGRGYPDVPTRRFLHLLSENLDIPVYCLVDCDPYGFDILSTYRFGSMEMAYDAEFLRVPDIRWLGVFTSDSELYALPAQCLLPLTLEGRWERQKLLARDNIVHLFNKAIYRTVYQSLSSFIPSDKRKIEALLHRCYLQREEPHWRLELERMHINGVKFEIEALSTHSISFLSKEYLPSKIQGMQRFDNPLYFG